MSSQILDLNARASPAGDARRPRPSDVGNLRGLPTPRRGGLKKLVHLRISTINIGTMTGRSRELAETLKTRRIDIACIQETKWKGAKAREIGEGYKLYYNGDNSTRNGVGIVISEKYRDNVVDVHRISDRLMTIKIESGATTLRIVTCYAPQTGCPDDEKDEFWEGLDAHLRTVGPEEHLILGGDLNGHVGLVRDGYNQYHGGNGFGTRNDNGNRILDSAEAHELVVANTFFKKRPTHLITYTSGGHMTQIDYLLVRRRDLKLVTNVKVIPSESIAPQHRLLVMDLQLDILGRKRPRVTGVERTKWWRLPTCKAQLKAALGPIDVDTDQPASAMWDKLVGQVHAAATTILGKTKPGKRAIDKQVWWWNEEVQTAVKEKKKALKAWFQYRNDEDLRRYKALKSSAKRAVAAAKAAYYDHVYDELDTPEGENKIYRLANARHQATQDIGQIKHVKDEDHRLLRDPPAILRRWSDYFSKISNEEFDHPPIQSADPVPGPAPPITIGEVEDAMKKMKNGKATGPDDIPAEVWKILGRQGATILAALFNRIIEEGAAPSAWTTSTTVPIWKGKGDVTECSNYRPIRLLCHAMKIFERIIDARLRKIISITPNQCGFVKGSGTTDAIHAARLLLEKHREKTKPVHMAFLDLEKAFDRVPHELIWHALRSHDVPEAYVQWIQLLYHNVTSVVRCAVGTSPSFAINVGVHQGSALSPLLFVLCMDTVTSDLQSPHPWSLLYADDVFLANRQHQELQEQTRQWNERLSKFGLRLNIKKTEYMECGPQTDGTISIGGEELKKVEQFKYLGSLICSNGDSFPDARARVNAAWMKWRQVTGVLCDRRMPLRLKSKVYKTVVRPVALYGSECWPATAKHEQALHVMEMRMLRWSLGLTRFDHAMNNDVRRRLGVAPITAKMREGRLRWYGHVVRSDEHSVARTAMRLDPDGRRPRGRPKKRWMDRIKEDMQHANVAPEDALDRAKWRQMCRQADPAIARE
uniref:Reverse transcriptase domain-containing protein n=1 Tax=Plectus sambesii TaxID=2011161 RepID=A0A914X4N9_9BILA